MDNDLSEYEKVRLANIRRNAEFLSQLGLQKPSVPAKKPVEQQQKAVERVKRERSIPLEPTRKSRRLQEIDETESTKIKEYGSIIEEKESEETVDFERFPENSNELDDFEFQVYAALRQWRLLKCRELSIEPYKICQNRTIAEMVRRKRNEPDWASFADTNREDESPSAVESSERRQQTSWIVGE